MNYVVTNLKKLTNIFSEIRTELETHPNEILNVSWEKTHRPKTFSQLGFMFGGLIKAISKHYVDYFGKEYDVDIIKEMLYNECSRTEEFVCPNGKILYETKRISRMTVEEMSEFISKVIDFCDEYGIVLQPELKYLWINNLDPRLVEEVEQTKFPEKDEDYLRHIRKQTCLICGKYNCEAHHLKDLSLAGLGQKTPDYMAVSLCPECHRYIEGNGHISTEKIKNLVPFAFKRLTPKQFCKLNYYRYLKHK